MNRDNRLAVFHFLILAACVSLMIAAALDRDLSEVIAWVIVAVAAVKEM